MCGGWPSLSKIPHCSKHGCKSFRNPRIAQLKRLETIKSKTTRKTYKNKHLSDLSEALGCLHIATCLCGQVNDNAARLHAINMLLQPTCVKDPKGWPSQGERSVRKETRTHGYTESLKANRPPTLRTLGCEICSPAKSD